METQDMQAYLNSKLMPLHSKITQQCCDKERESNRSLSEKADQMIQDILQEYSSKIIPLLTQDNELSSRYVKEIEDIELVQVIEAIKIELESPQKQLSNEIPFDTQAYIYFRIRQLYYLQAVEREFDNL